MRAGARRRLVGFKIPTKARRNAVVGTLASGGLVSIVYGIAGWSPQAAEIVGGLLALAASVGYFRGAE